MVIFTEPGLWCSFLGGRRKKVNACLGDSHTILVVAFIDISNYICSCKEHQLMDHFVSLFFLTWAVGKIAIVVLIGMS